VVQVHSGPPVKGGLAQLGERLPCTQKVSGSIPLASTNSCFFALHLADDLLKENRKKMHLSIKEQKV